jgi:drug/metabolite transporter (DMT)-like permease
MSPFVVTLVMASAFMHAGWNLLARGRGDPVAFIGRMLAASTVVGFVPAVATELYTRSLPPGAWACVAASAVCGGLYCFFLARAYSMADFTIVYPVARGLPVVFVGLGDVIFGRGVPVWGWVGLVMVASGCFLAPLHSFYEVSLARYFNKSTAWILLVALAIVGFTLFDKAAAERVSRGAATAARYCYFYFAGTFLVYRATLVASRDRSPVSKPVGWFFPALAALFNFGGYWLVLWSYQLSGRASYVIAFRQTSILIGVAVAFALYGERGLAVRLTGAVVITAGLVIITVIGS